MFNFFGRKEKKKTPTIGPPRPKPKPKFRPKIVSTIDDGGFAFPTSSYNRYTGNYSTPQGGMSLRDYFAATATDEDIKYLLQHNPYTPTQKIRYMHADLMLKERKR